MLFGAAHRSLRIRGGRSLQQVQRQRRSRQLELLRALLVEVLVVSHAHGESGTGEGHVVAHELAGMNVGEQREQGRLNPLGCEQRSCSGGTGGLHEHGAVEDLVSHLNLFDHQLGEAVMPSLGGAAQREVGVLLGNAETRAETLQVGVPLRRDAERCEGGGRVGGVALLADVEACNPKRVVCGGGTQGTGGHSQSLGSEERC